MFHGRRESCDDAAVNRNLLRWLITALVAFTGPIVFGFDLLMRQIVVGTQPQDLQDFMAEHVTRIAWWGMPFPVAGAVAGLLLYPGLYRRMLKRHLDSPPSTWTPQMKAELEALFLAASLVQLPALIGDFSVLLGARLQPALCSMSISTVAVMLIAVRASRMREANAPGA
jgi:hypothetical protein